MKEPPYNAMKGVILVSILLNIVLLTIVFSGVDLLQSTAIATSPTVLLQSNRLPTVFASDAPMILSLKKNLNINLTATVDWEELNDNINAAVRSDGYCSRRNAMTRAAAMVAGVSALVASSPGYTAETKQVKMGVGLNGSDVGSYIPESYIPDVGYLTFEPRKISICKGDSVEWVNNVAGPHSVLFDEDLIPTGVTQEELSMVDKLYEVGDTFTMKFDVAGTYEYFCVPHRGAGMNARLVVAG